MASRADEVIDQILDPIERGMKRMARSKRDRADLESQELRNDNRKVEDNDTIDNVPTRPGDGPPWSRDNLPNPDGDGPVTFYPPEGATDAEIAQFHDYVNRSNDALGAGQLSATGRVRTAGEVAREATNAASRERTRAANAGTPYQGVAAHVPDSTWVGGGNPPGWGDYTSRVNSSLAGQVNRYPVGFKPTIFEVGTR